MGDENPFDPESLQVLKRLDELAQVARGRRRKNLKSAGSTKEGLGSHERLLGFEQEGHLPFVDSSRSKNPDGRRDRVELWEIVDPPTSRWGGPDARVVPIEDVTRAPFVPRCGQKHDHRRPRSGHGLVQPLQARGSRSSRMSGSIKASAPESL